MTLKLAFSTLAALSVSSLLCRAQLTIAADTVATVNWGAQSNVGLGTAQGVELAVGDLVRIGSFSLTPAQIRAAQFDYTALNAAFVQYDTASIGLEDTPGQPLVPGQWSKSSSLSTDALGLDGQKIYYWAFNAASPESATQQGIFTHSDWVFPADASVPASIVIDLSQVSHTDSSELVVGGYGTGLTSGTANPLYNLAPVPEPSATAAVFAGACLLGVAGRKLARRRA
jgi:hypothetical protein